MRKIWIVCFIVLMFVSGCSKKNRSNEDTKYFIKMHEDVIEEIIERENFNIVIDCFVGANENGYFNDSRAQMELDFLYNGKVLHMPMFRNRPYIENGDGTIVEYVENSESKEAENAWYSLSRGINDEKDITIHLFKRGTLLEGYATCKKFLGEYTLWSFYYQLEDEVIDNMSLRITGTEISLQEYQYSENGLSFFVANKDRFLHGLILLVITVVLAVIAFFMTDNLPISLNVWIIVDTIIAALLLYGVLGILTNFVPKLGYSILHFINSVFASVSVGVSFTRGILGAINGFMPYVAIVLAILGLIYVFEDVESIFDYFLILLTGMMCIPLVHVVLGILGFIFVAGVSALLKILGSLLFIGIFALMASSGGDGGSDGPAWSVEEKKEEEQPQPQVEVWRENEWGFVEERYKVSRDGERYYKDGEWHKIKK